MVLNDVYPSKVGNNPDKAPVIQTSSKKVIIQLELLPYTSNYSHPSTVWLGSSSFQIAVMVLVVGPLFCPHDLNCAGSYAAHVTG